MLRLTPAFLAGAAALALAACDANEPTGPAEPTPVDAGTAADVGGVDGSASLSLTRAPKSFYVNPKTGSDGNPGTNLKPFKTLAHSLSLAISGDTLRLAQGVYSAAANGEKFSDATHEVAVPAGVTILGTQAEDFTSQLHGGAGQTGLKLKGAAIVKDLILTGFDKAIHAEKGNQSFKRLFFDDNVLALDLTGTAKGTLTSSTVSLRRLSGVATGTMVTQQAQFIMDAGTVTPGEENCKTGYTGVDVRDAAQATLRNGAFLKNIAGTAVRLSRTAKVTLKGNTTLDRDFLQAPGCKPLPSIRTFESASLTLSGARLWDGNGNASVGLEANSDAPLTITSATFSDHSGSGLRLTSGAKVVISSTSFSGNTVGIDATPVASPNLTITGSTLQNNFTGIISGSLILRNSNVLANGVGILVDNEQADLGRIGDPGNNTITGSSLTGVAFSQKAINLGGGTIFADGNTWLATQGADVSGHYSSILVLSGLSQNAVGKNFQLPNNKNFLILF